MANWFLLVGVLVLGFCIGYGVSVWSRSNLYVGTLREDNSDPTEAPYLFLEMEPGGMEKINKYKTVLLRVKIEDYLPRRYWY